MNKRGQVYILAALILIGVLFTLSLQPNKIVQSNLNQDFNALSENYVEESNRLINSLYNTENKGALVSYFENFTVIFTSYSKSQNPSMGLFYVFTIVDKNTKLKQAVIGNFLDFPIEIVGPVLEDNIIMGCFEKINATVVFEGLAFSAGPSFEDIRSCVRIQPTTANDLTINVKGILYTFKLIEGVPQLMVVTRQDEAGQRQIFVEGDINVQGSEYSCDTDQDCADLLGDTWVCKNNQCNLKPEFESSLLSGQRGNNRNNKGVLGKIFKNEKQ